MLKDPLESRHCLTVHHWQSVDLDWVLKEALNRVMLFILLLLLKVIFRSVGCVSSALVRYTFAIVNEGLAYVFDHW